MNSHDWYRANFGSSLSRLGRKGVGFTDGHDLCVSRIEMEMTGVGGWALRELDGYF